MKNCICNSYWLQTEKTPGEFHDPENLLLRNRDGLKVRVMHNGCPIHKGHSNHVQPADMRTAIMEHEAEQVAVAIFERHAKKIPTEADAQDVAEALQRELLIRKQISIRYHKTEDVEVRLTCDQLAVLRFALRTALEKFESALAFFKSLPEHACMLPAAQDNRDSTKTLMDAIEEAMKTWQDHSAEKLKVTLHDAAEYLIEEFSGPADEAIRVAGQFMLFHGTDPDENGKDAMAGSIRFEPVRE